MSLTIRELCDRAIILLRGKRLILTTEELSKLNALDYEGLASLHAQDEAVVCAMNFERVRDRLLQLYPWTFARTHLKSKWSLVNSIPDDFLTMLCVLKDGEPIEYDIRTSGISSDADEIIYTAKVTDINKWSPVFCEVFVYSLAIEICPSVTGKPEYTQLLEQKVQELIHRAYQIGAIKAETRLSLKDELYNRAIGLARGTRSLKESSTASTQQGADNAGFVNDRMTAEYQACVRASDSVRDRLLELYAWTFARKSTELQVWQSSLKGWLRDYTLPEDCLRVISLVDHDGTLIDYEETAGTINCNVIVPTLRYTARIEDMSLWSGTFSDVFCYTLAQEIVLATTGNIEIIQLLESKAQSVIQTAHRLGEIRAEIKIPLSEELYNRAIALVRGQRILSPVGQAASEQGLDITGDINYREREAILVCKRSMPELRDRLLKMYAWKFARKTANIISTSKKSGWHYAYKLPEDCMRVLAVLSGDEYVEYEESDGLVLCDASGSMTVRYSRAITDLSELDSVFREVLCYELAEEISSVLSWNSENISLLEQKKQLVIQNAYRTGLIREEANITPKEELFIRAVSLAHGQRTIGALSRASLEQGLDTIGDINSRYREEVLICSRSYEFLRNKLLRMYGWKFARRTAVLSSSSKVTGWDNAYILPSGYMKVLAVFSGDEPVEYEISDDKILCNVSGYVSIRYTSQVEEINNLSPEFKEVLCCYLAGEIISGTTNDKEQIQYLEAKAQRILQDCYRTGLIQEETITPLKDELIARAVNLSYGTRTASPMSDASVSQGLDNAGMRDNRYLSALKSAKQSYEMIRRSLQEMYPWVFLRRNAKLSSTAAISGWSNGYVRPSDCLTVLNVLVNGEPVYYEEISDKILCDGAGAEIRYSGEVENLKNCTPMFREVFCQKLAQEVILSTTNDMNVWQALEQHITQIIQHGYMTGQIQNETHISLKQELYNRAISLSHGARTQKSTSEAVIVQGLDYGGIKNPRNIEEIRVCRNSTANVRDKLLQIYPWVFAKKSAVLSPSSTISGWNNGYVLPADCMQVLTVLTENEPIDYEVINNYVYCNGANASVRYTARIEDMTTWSSGFVNVFCYELAEEIISATTRDNEAIALLEKKKQELILDAYKMGTIKTETRIPAKYELFNRAIGLVKGLKTEKADTLDTRYEDELSACRRGHDSILDRLLQSYAWVFCRKTDVPAQLSAAIPGWRYTYLLPSDCLRVIAVIGQDKRASWDMECDCRNISDFSDAVELTDYEVAGRELYVNRDVVYIRYTARIEDYTKWVASFTEAFVILLAIEIALNVVGDKNIVVILEQRLARLIEDAKLNGIIRDETGLPKQRESRRAGVVNRMYLDYSGIPTLPCNDYARRCICDESRTG